MIENLNTYLRSPDTKIMVVQVGFNVELKAVTLSIVVLLPTNRYMYVVLGMLRPVVKTFYITNHYKNRKQYNCKKTSEVEDICNLNVKDCIHKFHL